MKKIPSLFKRDYKGTRLVYDEVVEGSEWVINGEGIATRKWDGTACLIQDGKYYKRYDVKKGRTVPPDFMQAQEPDTVTGHWPGWVPVSDVAPEDKYHREAWIFRYEDGTYELCGPKVQGNPEGLDGHRLIRHGADVIEDVPLTFDGLREWFAGQDIEGIVWHRGNGDMVKMKKKDFGLVR